MFVSPPGETAVRRRMTADELIAAVRRDRGVLPVDGYARQVGGRRVRTYGDGHPIAAAGLLVRAYLIRQDGGELEWETAPVPAGDLDVVFLFPWRWGTVQGSRPLRPLSWSQAAAVVHHDQRHTRLAGRDLHPGLCGAGGAGDGVRTAVDARRGAV
jgi:hypothetical protein